MLARMLSFVFVRFVTGAAIVVRALEILSSVVRSGRAMMLIIIDVEWGKESRDQRSIQGNNCRKEITHGTFSGKTTPAISLNFTNLFLE